MTHITQTRIWGAATAAIGAAMLTRPAAVAQIATGANSGGIPNLTIVRVLGGRQLLQGTAVLALPGRSIAVTGGSIVDLLHACTMLAAAMLWPHYRRPALASAAIAGTSAVTGILIRRRR